ncbi:MAG: TetR/AcrR family transcriptional regulator [Myxococcota bacterium]
MTRRRRSAAEARTEILDAARVRLLKDGPQGLRLDDIATDVGVTRQALLHHFGSKEELLRVVIQEAWITLFRDLRMLGSPTAGTSLAEVITSVDDAARGRGNARLGAWLLLTGQGLPAAMFESALADLPQVLGQGPATTEERRYALLLVGAALFGDAVFGTRLRQALGLPEGEEQRAAFHRWLGTRLEQVLAASSSDAA